VAKPKRARGPVPPPPTFPEPPRGFTVLPIHSRTVGDDHLMLLNRNIPQDWDLHAKRITDYAQAIRKAYQGRSVAHEAIGGHAWYPLHWAWQEHPDFGVGPFFERVASDIEQRFPPVPDQALEIGIVARPEGRHFQPAFPDPHILLALFPDGEFTRLLVTEVLGLVAVTARHVRDQRSQKGPICFAVRGQVLDDGRVMPGLRLLDNSIILMDPLVMVGDFGPSERVEDGRHLYTANPNPERTYHPDDKPWFALLREEQQRYVRMWDGPVPGFVGRLGQFRRFMEQGRQEEAQHHAQVPTHAVYAQALDAQLAILGFCRRERPYERVSRLVAEENHRRTDGEYFRFVRTEDDTLIKGLETAHPVFWTADMLAVLEGLEPSLKVWEVRERDFLHHSGFVWFERPLRVVEGDPEIMTGYLWHLREYGGQQGYAVTPFTRYEGRPEDVPRDIWSKSVSGNSPHHGAPRRVLFFPLGTTLADFLTRTEEYLSGDPQQAVLAALYSGTTPDLDRKQLTGWGRIFAASIVLMNQRLTRLSDFRADRAGRKRAQATLSIDHEPPLIKSVLLRRVDYVGGPKREPGEGGTVNWSHRWLVSFHWREQWYPSENRHKSIAIQPYEKGPKDKPLWVPKDGSVDLIGR
jgi:hypothetical protein